MRRSYMRGSEMGEKIFCRLTGLLALFTALWCFLSPTVFLTTENRTAAAFSLAGPDAFFTDRLPFRRSLLRLCRDARLFLGLNESSGAFLGKRGYVFSETETDAAVLAKNLDAAKAFIARAGIPAVTAIVGAKQETLVADLPDFYEPGRDELWQTLAKSGLQTADLLPVLRCYGGMGKYIYYRGDHHLTSLGSYYVYRALGESLGYTPYGAEDFSPTVICTDFSGSDARRMLLATNDRIALFRYRGDGGYTVVNEDTGDTVPLYDLEKTVTPDPYAVFPIAQAGRVTITRTGEKRPKLLVLCDSYGDALAPLLARHFDLDLVDPRYYHGSADALLRENDYAAILLYFGMDTLAANEILYRLNLN